jgi:ABC-type multidrug transport system ATPase subunit
MVPRTSTTSTTNPRDDNSHQSVAVVNDVMVRHGDEEEDEGKEEEDEERFHTVDMMEGNSNPSTTNDKNNNNNHTMIPLVEVSIENLSYAPLVATTTNNIRHKRWDVHWKNRTTTTSTTKVQKPTPRQKTILHQITTKIEPYQLTGWMGPSGSGKTSLLSVVAGLVQPTTTDLLHENSSNRNNKNIDPHTMIRVNQEYGNIPKQYLGVVWQEDLLLSNLTVEENLYIAARLKTSTSISNDTTVRNIVHETMKELNIYHIRHTLVGDPLASGTHRGISGGERKRVAVGMELVVRPSVLLLDEITSGLDSTTAYQLMITLQQLAHTKGHTIVVIIHQPRTTIFNLLDHLLLLSRGNVIYDGPPNQIRSYLELYYDPLPPETGIADWMMDIVTTVEKTYDAAIVTATTTSSADYHHHDDSTINNNNNHPQHELVQHWINYCRQMRGNDGKNSSSTTAMEQQQQQQQIRKHPAQRAMSTLQELRTRPKYNTSFTTQLTILLYRVMKQQRGERITQSALWLQVLYMFFTSLFWWRIPDHTGRIYERNSLLFFILIAQANSIVITAVTVFQRERVLLARERAKKMYSVSSYFIAKTLSDVTNNVFLPLLYAMVVYWTAGFRSDVVSYLKYIFVFYWIFSTAQSMGLFISIAIPNRTISLLFAPPITLFFAILGGFYIPLDNLHPGVKWATYLSFARYGYSALM